ncbi:phosphonate ABC transporter ATP-binding protein [bacterium]|nr:phosphonate ABC transporter ATP-binding protein [bacterium]
MREILDLEPTRPRHILKTNALNKVYPNGTVALQGISVSMRKDDFVVIIGSSGAGKSTFLRCLNLLIRPTAGSVIFMGSDISEISGRKLNEVRNRIGIIFQQFHLVRRLSVLENVLVGRLRFNTSVCRFPLSIIRLFSKEDKEIAFQCLKSVGIEELAFQRADTLSGGQQQRVAIARVLAQEPDVFLADEPIASLDPKSAEIVMEILRKIHETRKIPVLINLHHIEFAKQYGKRVIGMKDGRLVFDVPTSDLTNEIIEMTYGETIMEEKADRYAFA